MRPVSLRSGPPPGCLVVATLAAAVGLAGPWPAEALQVQGHAEVGLSVRYSDRGPHDDRILDSESRLLLERQWYGEGGEMLDVRVLVGQEFRGDGSLEIRQASLFLPVGRRIELTAGRQVLSWGPAQFEFVNDRFAKDFGAFFVGRDLEYLKAPNDAIRTKGFFGAWTVDLVLAPIFQEDRLPDPRKFPVMDPATGEVVANPDFQADLPEEDLVNGEVHVRLDRNLGRWETALYGYRGFTGAPAGVKEVDGGLVSFHPEMAAAGLSLRGPVRGGVAWFEAAYENIREEGAGADPRLPPDRWLALSGYRWSPTATRTWMVQGTVVGQLGARGLREALADTDPDHPRGDRIRYRLQGNLTQSLRSERMQVGARLLWGVTEKEAHWRLWLGYDLSDDLIFEARYHGFAADHPAGRFGLLRDHDLVSLRLRYHF